MNKPLNESGGRTCPTCGRPLAEHAKHFRSRWPDSLAQIPESDWLDRKWGNDDLLQVDGVGSFVRALVVVNLDQGETVTYRIWLEVMQEDLLHAWDVWETPAYAKLKLNGILANRLIGWPEATLNKFVEAVVLKRSEVPYVVNSTDTELCAIVHNEWPYHEVLRAINAEMWRGDSSKPETLCLPSLGSRQLG